MIHFEKKNKTFKYSYGLPAPRNFAADASKETLQWDHCLERFATKFTEFTPNFFYSHVNADENIAGFIHKFEHILSLSWPCNLSKFARTGFDSILYISPSDFWIDCRMKRSLFAMLVRAGANYEEEKDNFDDVLFSDKFDDNKYLRDTRLAIFRFMFGFTKFVGGLPTIVPYSTVVKHGWKEEFEKLDEFEIRQRLVAPETTTKSIVGLESLWT